MFKRKFIFPKNVSFETPFRIAWERFRKNRAAIGGLIILVIFFLLAILGYLISPDPSPNANTMIPEIALQPPGFRQRFLLVRKNETVPETDFFTQMLYGKQLSYNALPIVGLHVQGDSVSVELFRGSGVKTTHQILKIEEILLSASYLRLPNYLYNQNQIMSQVVTQTFILGTDTYGRDILSRLIIGVRISLAVGGMAVLISLLIGISLGAIAGYYGGKPDAAIMWLINVVWAIPTLLLVFAITIVLGKGFWQIFVAVGLTMWVQAARVVRGQVMSIRTKEYIEAAKSLGFRNARLILRHVLPNTMGPVMVIAASNFASAILIEAGLSFLGIGVQPPTPSWGSMIRENYGFIISSNPFLALAPGFAIMILVLAFNLIGSGLRDVVDVKMKTI